MQFLDMPLTKALVGRGWKTTGSNSWSLEKGEWRIVYDTSSWIEIGSIKTPRIFDVPILRDGNYEEWTINLIEHLCRCDDLIKGNYIQSYPNRFLKYFYK